MIRRLARLAGRAALGIAALAVLGAVFLRTPPGQNLSRQLLLGLLRRGGLEARLDGVQVHVPGLEVTVEGLALGAPGREPFLLVEGAHLRLSASSLGGRLGLRRLEARGLRLSLSRGADGRWNLPEGDGEASAAKLDLRPYLAGDVVVHDVAVAVRDEPSGLQVEAKGLRLNWSGQEGRGRLEAGQEAVWRRGVAADAAGGQTPRAGRLTLAPTPIVREGDRLRIDGPDIQFPEGQLSVRAALEDIGSEPRAKVHVSGRANLDLGGLPAGLQMDGDFDPAGLRLNARAEAAEGRAVASASMPPEGTARVLLEWNDLRVGRIVAALSPTGFPLDGRLSGKATAQWPVEADDVVTALEGEARARVEPTHSGEGTSGLHGETRLEIKRGAYLVRIDHALAGAAGITGRLEGRLEAEYLPRSSVGGTLRLSVDDPTTLARLLSPGEGTIALSGRAEARLAVGGTLEDPRANGPLEARGLRVKGGPLVDADARVEIDRRKARAEILRVEGGSLSATGSAERLADGRLTGQLQLDLASLADWEAVLPRGYAPSGRVQARATLSGSADRPRLAVEVEGHEVAGLGQPPVRQVRATLQASPDGVDVDPILIEQDRGRWEGSAALSADAKTVRVRGAFQDFALAPLPPSDVLGDGLPFAARLDGPLALEVEGDGTLRADGRIALRDVVWNNRPLGEATVGVATAGEKVEATVQLPSLRASATAHLEASLPHRYEADVRLEEATLEALSATAGAAEWELKGATSLRLRIAGETESPRMPSIEVELERLEGHAGPLPFRLSHTARLFVAQDRLGAAGLELQAAGFRVQADGTLEEAGRGALTVTVEGNLAGLQPWLQRSAEAAGEEALEVHGQVRARARVSGTPENPKPEASLTLTDGRALRDDEFLGEAWGLSARFAEGKLTLESLAGRCGQFLLSGNGEAGSGLLDPLLPAPTAGLWAAALRRALQGPAAGRLDLEARSQPQESGLEGESATAREGAREPLRLEARLETDALDIRRLRGRAVVHGLRLDLPEGPLLADRSLEMSLADGRLEVPEVTFRGGATDLRVGGTVRLADTAARLAESALDLRASGTADLRLLNAMGRGFEGGGLARVEATVGGSPAAPKLHGRLDVQDAIFRYRPWRLHLDDFDGSLVADDRRLSVSGLSGLLNGGTLTGQGEIEGSGTGNRSGRVDLALKGAILDWPQGFRAGLDGQLALTLTAKGPLLAGDLTLSNASYQGDPQTLATGGPTLVVPEEDKETGLLGRLALDLRLRTEPDVRVDNPFGRFAFGVDVKATGPASAPRLNGQVELQPQGYVYWSGRRFTLERGTLDWKAASGLMPFVQARALTRVSNYEVYADFSGPLDAAEAHLASNPPLSSNEITSLLVTGSAAASGTADSRALGIVSANFLGNMGRHAGLDSVRIDTGDDQSLLNFDPTKVVGETNPAQRLTITKRLSANLEATVSLNLSESGKTTTFVSWKPWASVELRAAQRDDSTGSLEARHDVAFGGGGTPRVHREGNTAPAAREVVTSVEIDDRARGATGPLAPKLSLRPGQVFSYKRWQQDRDRIEAALARRGHAEAYVVARRSPTSPSPGGGDVSLTYLVDRGPRTAIRLTGLDLPDSLRRELRRAWTRGDYERSIEAEAETRIRDHLAREGYFVPRLHARVETAAGTTDKTLVVDGERGPRLAERRLAFPAACELPKERFEALAEGKVLLAQAWNDPARLERAVTAECVRAGYLAARAVAGLPTVEGDRAVMRVQVDEGPAFTRGAVHVAGCSAQPCAEVEAALALPSGGRYRPEDNDAARARAIDLYRRGGWNSAQVRLAGKVHPGAATVSLEVQVDEGPRQVVESVVVEGGSAGTRRALDRLVKVKPGDPVDLRAWAEARKRVYATGLVRGVSLTPESPSESPLPDANADTDGGAAAPLVEPVVARLSYDEWPALRLRYGLQIVTEKPLTSTEDQAVDLGGTVEVTRATFLGRALTTGLSAEARADNWSVRGVVSAPRTFGHSLRSSLFAVREQETLEISDPAIGTVPATGDSWELTLEERYRLTKKVELALSYDIQWLDLSFSGPLGQETLSYRPARLVPTVLVDGRNQILDPTRGYFSSLTYNFGSKKLGSEFDFTRLFTQQFAYVPLPGRIVSASGLRYERSGGDEGQAFLTTERLGFGGATTIRGYDRGELELLDLLSSAGATTKVLLLNQEARFPIFGDLRGVAFFDYGRLQTVLDTATGTLVRMGTGLGLRYSTPVGVLRLDVGYPLRGEDKKARFYFGLGQAF